MRRLTTLAGGLVIALLVGGCTSGSGDGATPTTGTTIAFTDRLDVVAPDANRCDPIGEGCLLPFPNDHFTVADTTTPTGRRVALARESMPANAQGVHIDPTHWNQQDGFSPGSAVLFQLPNLDLTASGAAPISDIGASLAANAPIVLLDTDTGEHLPSWVEADGYGR